MGYSPISPSTGSAPVNANVILSSIIIIFSIIILNPLTKRQSVRRLVVSNGLIYTGDHSPHYTFVNEMVIRNGRISCIGAFSPRKVAWWCQGPWKRASQWFGAVTADKTEKLDLKGKIVVPGFIDSHVHFLYGGLQMAQVNLHGVCKKQEFIKKIKVAAKRKDDGDWVMGGGWNNIICGGELPAASWIDHITRDNPVWLLTSDNSMGLANSLALELAGISRYTKDPAGGTIMRTPDGEPTGVLIGAAMQLIISLIPEPSVDERREALLRASKYALSKGVTTVVDMGRYYPGSSTDLSWQDFTEIYSWATNSGSMMVRVCLFFPIATWSRLSLKSRTRHLFSRWLFLGGVTAFVDGPLGLKNVLLDEPYNDDPETTDRRITNMDSLSNMTLFSDNSELQVAIHVVGDRAIDVSLDMYESVACTNGMRDRRFRIEHARPSARTSGVRFGKLGTVASMLPEHLLDDANKGSHLFQTLKATDALLAFGSDWPAIARVQGFAVRVPSSPKMETKESSEIGRDWWYWEEETDEDNVSDIDPMSTIRSAVKTSSPGWKLPWIPSERITFTDALDAHTISAARACFRDKDIGSLVPGKLADFVVLSATSWKNLEKNAYASVEATYVGGIKAY